MLTQGQPCPHWRSPPGLRQAGQPGSGDALVGPSIGTKKDFQKEDAEPSPGYSRGPAASAGTNPEVTCARKEESSAHWRALCPSPWTHPQVFPTVLRPRVQST